MSACTASVHSQYLRGHYPQRGVSGRVQSLGVWAGVWGGLPGGGRGVFMFLDDAVCGYGYRLHQRAEHPQHRWESLWGRGWEGVEVGGGGAGGGGGEGVLAECHRVK